MSNTYPKQKLYVKNMVCPRCISSVKSIAARLHIPAASITLGEIELDHTVSDHKLNLLNEELKQQGFELIDNRINRIVEEIKKRIIQYLAGLSGGKSLKLSAYITQHVHYDYSYLSDLFSSVEGITIEQFFILQRIEKVKELLVYDEMSLAGIAFETGFSSTAHLSAQFKKITGLTTSHFKKIKESKRKSIGTA